MTVTFTEGYDYNGGNLLIGFAKDYTSGYSDGSFYGQEVSGASISGYSSSGYSSISATQRNFLPKTTISYSLNAFPNPKNLTVSNITNNSATITWEAPTSGTPTSYKYQYMPEGGSWTTLTSTTALTAPLSGLTGNTNYTVQVQAIYAGGESGFATKTFTTDCDAYPIPYSYGFEDVSDMNCWTKENIVSSGISDETSFGAGVPARTGNNFYVFQYVEYTSQSLPYQTIISPELSGITNGLHVEFYYRKYTNGEETFRVGYSTTDNDLASFTWGNEIDNATTDYQRFSANYPASTKYIAVQHTSDDQYYLFLDDFLFEEAASCLEPTNILVDNITTDGATVSWTPGASETAWDIFVTSDNTIVPDDGTTPTYANVTTNTNYSIGGLTSATIYYVYVRAICSENSAWSTPYTFHTECEGMPLPYSYDFEDAALPVCWNTINPNTSYNTVGITDLSTNKVLGFFRGTSATMAAVLPEVDANYQLNEYEITFDACYANTSSTSMTLGKLTVGIMTDPEDFSTFQPVEEIEIANGYPTFESYRVRFNNFAGSGQYIAIQNSSTMNGYVLVDNLSVSHLPACLEPENLTVDNASITGHEATLNWDGTSPEYSIEYRTAAGISPVITEGFENNGTNLPSTWSHIGNGSVTLNTTANRCHDGSKSARFSGATSDNVYVLPATSDEINTMMISFWSLAESSSSSGSFDVGYVTDAEDATTFTPVGTYAASAHLSYTHVQNVDLSSAPAGARAAFRHRSGSSSYWWWIDDIVLGTTIPAGAWESTTSNTESVTLENLVPETSYDARVKGVCGSDVSVYSNVVPFTTSDATIAPTNITVNDISSDEATIGWTGAPITINDHHASYELYWATEDVTEVPAVPAAPNYISGITATSQLVSGLTPSTNYKVWVRDNCGTDGMSPWAGPATFTTTASCPQPTEVEVSEVTSISAKISWDGHGETAFSVFYQADGETEWQKLSNQTSPCTINSLTDNTHYTVKVQATSCSGGAESDEISFSTPCNPITITASDSWTEDFEDPVTTAAHNTTTVADLVVPDCWDNYTDNTGSAYYIPHIIKSTAGTNGYNYSSPASQVLYFYGSGNGYAALPLFSNPINELQISFKWATEGSTQGTLTLGYITAEDDGTYNTFTAIGDGYASTSNTSPSYHQMKSETVYLNEVPTTATRLVFRWYYGSWYGANIDDIEISLLPSCYPVGTLSAATNLTSTSATLNWALVDDNQDAWQVQYATNDGFTEGVNTANATTNVNFPLTGLTASTTYYVRVRANCGSDGYSETWSNPISFTTADACPTPDNLVASNVTNNSATISWDGFGQTEFTLRYQVEGAGDDWTKIPGITNDYYTFIPSDNLDEQTTYNVQVMVTSCENDHWSSTLTFTTLCAPITIVQGTAWTEDFETPVVTTTYNQVGEVPGCWDNYPKTNASAKILTDDDQYNYASEGQVLYFYGSGNNYAALPVFSNPLNELQISFKYAFESNSYGTLTLGYITDEDDGTYNTFTQIVNGYTANSQNYHQLKAEKVLLKNVPANATRLVFRWYISSQWGANIDDIAVEVVSSYTKDVLDGKWYAISSPVNTPAVNEVDNLTDGTYDFYRYDEATATWENYKAHTSTFTTFENGRGYIYRNSGAVTVPFTYTSSLDEHLKGFNLVGNPYTTEATLGKVCYKLNTNGTWAAQLASYAVQPLEGVLVQATSTTDEFAFSISSKSAPKAAQTLALTVSGNGYEDVAYAMLEDGKGLNKVAHLAEDAPALSIPVDGSNYAIAYLGYEVESFPLTLNATAGEYTIAQNNQISGLSYCHLLDKETGKETDLLKGAYTFKANGNSDRFTVLLNASLENGEIAIWNGNSWIVNGEGTLQVFDVMGRRVYNQEVAGQSSLNTDELATGVYVIRLGEKSQKIVVK